MLDSIIEYLYSNSSLALSAKNSFLDETRHLCVQGISSYRNLLYSSPYVDVNHWTDCDAAFTV